jgi:TatD DNase family protein
MLIDTHCHLDDPQFAADCDRVIRRALDHGVAQMVCVGTDLDSSRKCVELAGRHDFIHAAAGVHPHLADRCHTDETFLPVADLAEVPRVVAVGETGLDYFKKYSRPERQQSLFRLHLALSTRSGKPPIIHCRDAYDDLFGILEEERRPPLRGVLHCFSGSIDDARRALDWGLTLSIAGPVTYPNASSLAEAVRFVPLDRMVVETDAPYLAPQPRRGQRNEPSYVRHTAEKISEIKGVSIDEVCEQTTRNARVLFGLPT